MLSGHLIKIIQAGELKLYGIGCVVLAHFLNVKTSR